MSAAHLVRSSAAAVSAACSAAGSCPARGGEAARPAPQGAAAQQRHLHPALLAPGAVRRGRDELVQVLGVVRLRAERGERAAHPDQQRDGPAGLTDRAGGADERRCRLPYGGQVPAPQLGEDGGGGTGLLGGADGVHGGVPGVGVGGKGEAAEVRVTAQVLPQFSGEGGGGGGGCGHMRSGSKRGGRTTAQGKAAEPAQHRMTSQLAMAHLTAALQHSAPALTGMSPG